LPGAKAEERDSVAVGEDRLRNLRFAFHLEPNAWETR
jgi:hypothetical protein